MKHILLATIFFTTINAFAQDLKVRIDIEKKAENQVEIFHGYINQDSPFVISSATSLLNPIALEVDDLTGERQFIYEDISVGSVVSLEKLKYSSSNYQPNNYSLTIENIIEVKQPVPQERLFTHKHSNQRKVTLKPYKTEKIHINNNIIMSLTVF